MKVFPVYVPFEIYYLPFDGGSLILSSVNYLSSIKCALSSQVGIIFTGVLNVELLADHSMDYHL